MASQRGEEVDEVEDESVKNKIISELTLENRRLKEDLAKTHYTKFRVEQDLQCKRLNFTR